MNNHANFVRKEKKPRCSSLFLLTRFVLPNSRQGKKKKAGASLNDIISIHDLVEYHVEIIWEIQQTTRAASQKREGECASINTTVDVGEREMQSLVELERPSRPILQDVVGVDEEAATLCTHVFLDTIPVKSFSQNSNYHTHHCSFLFVLNASRSSSI